MGRTVTQIHTAQARAAQRERTEKRLRLTVYRYFSVSVMIRHACELVAAQGGSAGWWLAIVCMLPGVIVYGMLALALWKTGCESVPEMAQKLFGKAGRRIVTAVTAVSLVIEGMASLAALATVFVDGVGTSVSAVLFMAVAAAVLCLCTEKDGLVHGIGLLRWVLGAFAVLIIVNTLAQARMDHLFPPGGDGTQSWLQACRMWWSMSWPMILLLYEAPPKNEGRGWLTPPVLVTGSALALCLALPHEMLTLPRTLAERMLLPGVCLAPGNRVLLMCLWTAGMGVTAVICAVRASDFLTLPWKWSEKWLPRLMLVLFASVHLLGMGVLERMLDALDGWMLAPFALMAAVLLITALCRGKKA